MEELMKASARLGDAVVDPVAWPSVMEDICRTMRTTGAILLQSDVRTQDVPRTPSVSDLAEAYFRDGWHTRDLRAARGVPLILGGQPVVIDQDIISLDEMRRDAFYNECLTPCGFKWWAGVGFLAGSTLWGFCFQRTPSEGPFEAEDKRVLAQISGRLTEAATLSKVVSRTVLTGMTNALNLVRQPALVVDRLGFVIDTNAAADEMFDSDIRVRDRQLCVIDNRAMAELGRYIDQIRTATDTEALPAAPIIVRRQAKPPLLVRMLPIEAAARSPFLGARALMIFIDLAQGSIPDARLLSQIFGLTAAEAKLAALLGAGDSIECAAGRLEISPATARTQLKVVFTKTDTHRQSELAALLSRLGSFTGN